MRPISVDSPWSTVHRKVIGYRIFTFWILECGFGIEKTEKNKGILECGFGIVECSDTKKSLMIKINTVDK